MRKALMALALAVGAWWGAPAEAQTPGSAFGGSPHAPKCTWGAGPKQAYPVGTCANNPQHGDLLVITDGADDSDCDGTGGGAKSLECQWDATIGAAHKWKSAGGGGAGSFDTVASGSNTTATMTVGTGASLAPTGSGTITANAYTGGALLDAQVTGSAESNEIVMGGDLAGTADNAQLGAGVVGDTEAAAALSRDTESPAAGDITGSLSAGYQIGANAVGAPEIATGAVAADELDETAVAAGLEAPLEAVLDLADQQGDLPLGTKTSGGYAASASEAGAATEALQLDDGTRPAVSPITTATCPQGWFHDADRAGDFDFGTDRCVGPDSIFYAQNYRNNGTTTTAGIDEAVDAACASYPSTPYGGLVVLPYGNVSITGTVSVPNCQWLTIMGHGQGTRIIPAAGTTAFTVADSDNILFTNFTIDFAVANAANIGIDADSGVVGPTIRLDKVFIRGQTKSGIGLRCDACLQSSIVDSNFGDWDKGIYLTGNVATSAPNAINIVNTDVVSTASVGLDVDEANSIISVDGGTFQSNDGVAIRCAAYHANGYALMSVENAHFENNTTASIHRPATNNGCGFYVAHNRFSDNGGPDYLKEGSAVRTEVLFANHHSNDPVSNATGVGVSILAPIRSNHFTCASDAVCEVIPLAALTQANDAETITGAWDFSGALLTTTDIDEATLDDDLLPFDDADSLFTATTLGPALEELNNSINAGVPNGAGAKLHWSQLLGVPAGFADGTDDGAGGGSSAALDLLDDDVVDSTGITELAFVNDNAGALAIVKESAADKVLFDFAQVWPSGSTYVVEFASDTNPVLIRNPLSGDLILNPAKTAYSLGTGAYQWRFLDNSQCVEVEGSTEDAFEALQCFANMVADVTFNHLALPAGTYDYVFAQQPGARTWGNGSDATVVWSWNLATGGPQITFSNGLVNVTSGALQVGGSPVVLGSRLLTGGTGVAAIGDLSVDRVISLDLQELTLAGGVVATGPTALEWGSLAGSTRTVTVGNDAAGITVLLTNANAAGGVRLDLESSPTVGDSQDYREASNNGVNRVRIKAPDALSADVDVDLEDDGTPLPQSAMFASFYVFAEDYASLDLAVAACGDAATFDGRCVVHLPLLTPYDFTDTVFGSLTVAADMRAGVTIRGFGSGQFAVSGTVTPHCGSTLNYTGAGGASSIGLDLQGTRGFKLEAFCMDGNGVLETPIRLAADNATSSLSQGNTIRDVGLADFTGTGVLLTGIGADLNDQVDHTTIEGVRIYTGGAAATPDYCVRQVGGPNLALNVVRNLYCPATDIDGVLNAGGGLTVEDSFFGDNAGASIRMTGDPRAMNVLRNQIENDLSHGIVTEYGTGAGVPLAVVEGNLICLGADAKDLLDWNHKGSLVLQGNVVCSRGGNPATRGWRITPGANYLHLTEGGNDLSVGPPTIERLGVAIRGIVPIFAGAAPVQSGSLEYDSTASELKYGDAGATRVVANTNEAQAFTADKSFSANVSNSASNGAGMRSWTHPTDCTALTTGGLGDRCWEQDANAIYVCEPTAGGCDTPPEWVLASGASAGASRYLEFTAAGCNAAASGPGWNVPTANGPTSTCHGTAPDSSAALEYPDGANATTAEFSFRLKDWDAGAIEFDLEWECTSAAGCSTNGVSWKIASACIADGEDFDNPTFNAAQEVVSSSSGTRYHRELATIASLTTTGCAAGERMKVQVQRDPTDADDALAASAGAIAATIKYGVN